ncbi:hypothetical protein [Ketogulonicigenium vulgare]|uniref:hypothetical protein n=1 Tax=Ketogulonicigenium vulgare TaxID=92945 RepID=UPI0002E26C5A|nr:hypothetical protein [Ketogulonicigenium vulgare]AOZ54308.1 hypothetical protein KVC_1291 [Ketogulonicigenium vulgare]
MDWLIGIAIWAGAIVLAWWQGRRSGREAVRQQQAEAAANADEKRDEMDAQIADDVDLANRAKRVGLVRPKD